MKTLFLLILLTRNGAGDINASFVNTETLEQCRQKAALVKGVFSASTIPVIENRCIQSNLEFSEFEHASASSMARYFYVLRFDNNGMVQVISKRDWYTCMAEAKREYVAGRVYCVSSVQRLKK
jgi:hypothetical protein